MDVSVIAARSTTEIARVLYTSPGLTTLLLSDQPDQASFDTCFYGLRRISVGTFDEVFYAAILGGDFVDFN